ncbi:MAG: hypothetical protein QOJ35_3981 [Solirubrobacteraceae bacterium]|jgi:PAS domain S-box-containing protein|nr:hypothetical protein [Solirubrobacteraceae bacterium]
MPFAPPAAGPASSRFARAVLDAAPDAVITIDERGATIEVNAAAERIFGFTRDEVLGRTIRDVVIPEALRPAHEAGLRRVLAGGKPRIVGRRVRLSAQRADGREILVEMTVSRTSMQPPRFTAWIRELSQLESDRAAEDDHRALLDAGEKLASVGSWEWTPSRSKLLWSDNVYRILGLRPGDVSPDPNVVVELTHPDDRERVRARQEVLRVSGELPSSVESRIVRRDGEVRHLRTTVSVAERRGDEPYRFVGCVEDVTERLRAGRAIDAHMAVARATTAWGSFEQGAQGLLSGLAVALECQGGVIWLPRKAQLVARMVWRDATADPSVLDGVKRGSRLRRGGSLAWTAWTRREALLSPSALAIPAVFGEELLALFELRSRTRLERTEPLMRALSGIGGELGQILDEHRDELDMPLLSPREIEVLELAARGLSAIAIADQLVISHTTVRSHFQNLYPKLGVSDRAAAVAAALRLGVFD